MLTKILAYLAAESRSKRGVELDVKEWKRELVLNIPLQVNGWDCGVFLCVYAERSSRLAKFDFNAYQMSHFRRLIAWQILNQTLEYP
jgi:sentrin-specific protease 1